MAGQIIGIIGGTGLGETFDRRESVERVVVDTPFGQPSAPILRTEVGGATCLFLNRHGEGHRLNPSNVPYRANVYALKKLGATQIIASGATGSLREEVLPGHLVICDQVIDKTFRRIGTFFDEGLVAHVELADPFCERLRKLLLGAARSIGREVHDGGTYICMEGPQFSTRAESKLHRAWGGDLIGMTCMPEAKLAREAEICYALIAMPTDYDCWRAHDPETDRQTLLAEIISNMQQATDAATALIKEAIRRIGKVETAHCECHDALQLAIWSDKQTVDGKVVEKLKPLVGKYFAGRTPED